MCILFAFVWKASSKTSIQRFKVYLVRTIRKILLLEIHLEASWFAVRYRSCSFLRFGRSFIRLVVRSWNVNTFNIFPYYLWFRITSMHMYYLQYFAIQTEYIYMLCAYSYWMFIRFERLFVLRNIYLIFIAKSRVHDCHKKYIVIINYNLPDRV